MKTLENLIKIQILSEIGMIVTTVLTIVYLLNH